MKKTISALLMAGLLPLSVADSLAATSGTINFTGTVAEGTCTVQDLNTTLQLKNISAEEVNNTAHQGRITFDFSPYIHITNCPASISNAKLRFDYESEVKPQYVKLAAGSMPGVALILNPGGDVQQPGHVHIIPISNGKGKVIIGGSLFRNVNDPDMGVPAQSVTEGTYSAVVNLSMSFE